MYCINGSDETNGLSQKNLVVIIFLYQKLEYYCSYYQFFTSRYHTENCKLISLLYQYYILFILVKISLFFFFIAKCHLLQKRRILLIAHGLDTVSQVFLNNRLLGTSDNMFIRYQFDVKSLLEVNFHFSVLHVTYKQIQSSFIIIFFNTASQ